MLGSHKKIMERFHAFFDMDTSLAKNRIQDWGKKFEAFMTVENLYTNVVYRPSHLKRFLTNIQGVVGPKVKLRQKLFFCGLQKISDS